MSWADEVVDRLRTDHIITLYDGLGRVVARYKRCVEPWTAWPVRR